MSDFTGLESGRRHEFVTPGETIEVDYHDEDGVPLSGWWWILEAEGVRKTGRLDENGHAKITGLATRKYRLSVSQDSPDLPPPDGGSSLGKPRLEPLSPGEGEDARRRRAKLTELFPLAAPTIAPPDPGGEIPHPHCPVSAVEAAATPLAQAPAVAQSADPCLSRVPRPPQFILERPVRDLTREVAFSIVAWLVAQGFIKLANVQLQFNPACQVIVPTASWLLDIGPTVTFPSGNTVTWYNLATHQIANIPQLDVRGIVLLWKFSKRMFEDWGAQLIYHPGISLGGGTMHVEGRGVDFNGIEGLCPQSCPEPSLAGVKYDLQVREDWGWQPVPKGFAPPTAGYRLEGNKTSTDNKKRAAAFIFEAAYGFCVKECTDTSENHVAFDPVSGADLGEYNPRTGKVTPFLPNQPFGPNFPPTKIGQSQRFIIGPDHPHPKLRTDHDNHLHFQISTSGSEIFKP